MSEHRCMSLCDIDKRILRKAPLTKYLERYGECERIYVGSYFCGKYFMQIREQDLKEIKELCDQKQIMITLVVPTFSENDLAEGISKIHLFKTLLDQTMDEFTFNDFGMMNYLSKTYHSKLNMGRLLVKDYRDPRYQEYFQMTLKPKIFHQYLSEWIKDYGITGVEIDPTHAAIDFAEAPEGIAIGIHAPFCYVTMGRICEYASIGKEIDQKFRANNDCHLECSTNLIRYNLEDGMQWIRVGRAVYFKNETVQLKNLSEYRLIYFPIEWEEEQ
ncbi:hypothetical protein lbkm_2074 [Lachnospiraceae bacterium KM106-2]|nr:hypothetical protein lbkm_2074 [Lachnospiraceae bacterium KM106-2]